MVGNEESNVFGITRGTKQGDPINPPLFNAVLEKAMARLKETWIHRGWGIRLGVGKEERLLNLRFADDILLVAKSLKVLTKMMEEMRVAVGEVGLEMHFGKTKILANVQGRKQSSALSANVGANEVDILSEDQSTKYLGRALAFSDYHDREIRHRIACGWAEFTQYERELSDKKIFGEEAEAVQCHRNANSPLRKLQLDHDQGAREHVEGRTETNATQNCTSAPVGR